MNDSKTHIMNMSEEEKKDVMTRRKAYASDDTIPLDDVIELYREVILFKRSYKKSFFFLIIFDNDEFYLKILLYCHVFLQFKPLSKTDNHSSSMVDLFTSFNQTIQCMKNLN